MHAYTSFSLQLNRLTMWKTPSMVLPVMTVDTAVAEDMKVAEAVMVAVAGATEEAEADAAVAVIEEGTNGIGATYL